LLPRLLDLVQMLLTPAAERDLTAGVPEPDLAPPPQPDVFTDVQWKRADALLAVDGVPRRLSGLLAAAREADAALPHLIVLRVLYAVSPELGIALRQGDDQVLLAIDDGTPLVDPEFGGADLLVGVARLAGPAYLDTVAPGRDDREGEVA
jgi:hypothetical protein